MKVLRTIETFYPYVCGPANQAFQISKRLYEHGITSPVLTTYCDINKNTPNKETLDGVEVFRFKNQAKLMRYCLSLGMADAFKDYDIIHSHNYRNFQSDMAFFFRKFTKNPSSFTHMGLCSDSKDISSDGNPSFHMDSTMGHH